MQKPVTLSGSYMAKLISLLSPRAFIFKTQSELSSQEPTIKHCCDSHLVSSWQRRQLLLTGQSQTAKKVLIFRCFLKNCVHCHTVCAVCVCVSDVTKQCHRPMEHPSFIIDIDLGARRPWTAGGDTGPRGNIGRVPAEPDITVLPVSISILGDLSQVWSRMRTTLLFGKRAPRHYVPMPMPR